LPWATPSRLWYGGTSGQVVRGETTKFPVLSSGGAISTALASAGEFTHISGAAPAAQRLASAITANGKPRVASWFVIGVFPFIRRTVYSSFMCRRTWRARARDLREAASRLRSRGDRRRAAAP